MITITPSQRMISDRFPVASFVVHVPGDRLFEIACATDPMLFRSDHTHRRTQDNFFTSRSSGLLRAPAGEATYLLPTDQLKRFAGKSRLYYALGAYRSPTGEDPLFTTEPLASERAPFVALSPDFSGKTLDRMRVVRSAPGGSKYGGPKRMLAWGGDLVRASQAAAPAPVPAAAPNYDDGYPADLWGRAQGEPEDPPDPRDEDEPPPPAASYGGYAAQHGGTTAPGAHESYGRPVSSRTAVPTASEPAGYEDARSIPARSTAAASYGAPVSSEPPGAEDGRSLAAARFGGDSSATSAEPSGFEDGAAIRRRGSYGSADDAVGSLKSRLGETPPQVGSDFQSGANAARPLSGVDDSYDDEDSAEDGALVAAPSQAQALEAGPSALTIQKKYQLILPIADFEGGPERYTAINADSEFNDPSHPAYQRLHYGLHFGFMQLNQRSGALGQMLTAARRRSAEKFIELFGPKAEELLAVTNAPTQDARVAAVDGSFLWQEPWLGKFRLAGDDPHVQAAQNEVAIERYFDGQLAFASRLGLTTDRALAMLYDRTVNMGRSGARRFVLAAIGPQKQDVETMLDKLVEASRGRRFETRVKSLRSSNAYNDEQLKVL